MSYRIKSLLLAILVISIGLGIYRYFNPRLPYVVQQLRSTAIEEPLFSSKTSLGGHMSTNVKTWKDEDVLNIYMVTRDLGPLGEVADKLKNLKGVYLSESPINDISPLAKFPQLKRVYLRNTEVMDLRPLSKLKLKYLDLHGTKVSDLSPLHGMTSLEYLILGGTRATEAGIIELQKKLPYCEIRNDLIYLEPEAKPKATKEQ